MSGLHLSHKIPWTNLSELLLFPILKDNGIELPVGECGHIHLTSRRIELQFQHHKSYLEKQTKICTAENCKLTGVKIFHKETKGHVNYSLNKSDGNHRRSQQSFLEDTKQGANFIKSFAKTIREFSDTEREKISKDKNGAGESKIIKIKDVVQDLKSASKWPTVGVTSLCNECVAITTLIELGDIRTLLSIDPDELRACFGCHHGGQGVGNNLQFLTHHIVNVYVYTNIIFLSDLQDKPESWGVMKPDSYFRRMLTYDCDGQTFLSGSRKYLTEDVFMKDFDGMKQLCKNCFQFLYFMDLIKVELGIHNGESLDTLITEINMQYIIL